jgi:hypothetical protein
MKRPDVDQITARYKEMYAKVRQTISATVPSGELTIASDKKTDILLMSGCHLTAAAKQRGRPTPPPAY